MAIIGNALRQSFMPKREYESLREEEKAWGKLQRPLTMAFVALSWLAIIVCTVISLKIVFPGRNGKKPFCVDRRLQSIQIGLRGSSDLDLYPGAFYLTDQEIADYYWMVMFIPSLIVFVVSVVYLIAGCNIIVQKILLDDVGLDYICATAERFFVVGHVLANMVAALAEKPSSRLLKHII